MRPISSQRRWTPVRIERAFVMSRSSGTTFASSSSARLRSIFSREASASAVSGSIRAR
jgi:hypothetical protein